MAASSPKQLREHLREQQEPFDLHIYILERIVPHHSNQGCKFDVTKRKLYTKNMLMRIICKFIRHKCSLEDLNCHKVENYNLMSKMARKLGLIGEAKRSSGLCTVGCSSNQEKPTLHLWRKSHSNNKHSGFTEKEVALYTNKLGESEDYRQPASMGCQFRFSASRFRTERLNQAEFIKFKRKDSTISSSLQHYEQLLIHSTNDATEMHQRETTYEKCTRGTTGLEDARKFRLWRNQKPTQDMNFDVSNVIEDWSDMQNAVKQIIVIEIGDHIMEKVIQQVTDLIFV